MGPSPRCGGRRRRHGRLLRQHHVIGRHGWGESRRRASRSGPTCGERPNVERRTARCYVWPADGPRSPRSGAEHDARLPTPGLSAPGQSGNQSGRGPRFCVACGFRRPCSPRRCVARSCARELSRAPRAIRLGPFKASDRHTKERNHDGLSTQRKRGDSCPSGGHPAGRDRSLDCGHVDDLCAQRRGRGRWSGGSRELHVDQLIATIRIGPDKGLRLAGSANLQIAGSGGISGSLVQPNRAPGTVVGQANGHAINLVFSIADHAKSSAPARS